MLTSSHGAPAALSDGFLELWYQHPVATINAVTKRLFSYAPSQILRTKNKARHCHISFPVQARATEALDQRDRAALGFDAFEFRLLDQGAQYAT